jgi:tetratricopeptide (TPR) repeat protein
MKTREKSPFPKGWQDRFFAEADLERSYRELAGYSHFFAETMRGRIRSLQLRFGEAWEHFEAADCLKEHFVESVANLTRQFLLEIYRFENALVERSVEPDIDVPECPIPDIDPAILGDFPEVKYVIDLRKLSEAVLRLHLGECAEAAELYEQLIRENPGSTPDRLASWYLGLAACQHTLGLHDAAAANLENASYAAQAIEPPLIAVAAGVTLHAIHRFLEKEEEARDWQAFVERIRCPEITKELFLKRAERLFERCREHNRLVVF